MSNSPRPPIRFLTWEILLLLAVTFGTSGYRAIVRLIESLARPEPLGEQSAQLNTSQSALGLVDIALQLASSGVLFAWGGLALLLLLVHRPDPAVPAAFRHPGGSGRRRWLPTARDAVHGAGLAALIGLPGLALYGVGLALGLSKQVVPTGLGSGGAGTWGAELPLLVLNSWANGWAEEVIVVLWLVTRLRQLGWGWGRITAASALLRGSYHLYQGVSAGVGNVLMGVIFVWYYRRYSRVWPLIIAHGLIDTVAFVGYALLF